MARRTLFPKQTYRVNGYITKQASAVLERSRKVVQQITGWKSVSDGAALEVLLRGDVAVEELRKQVR